MRHLRHSIWGIYHGTGETVPLVNRTFEWGVIITTFLSVLSPIVTHHCACLTYDLRRLWHSGSIPLAMPPLLGCIFTT